MDVLCVFKAAVSSLNQKGASVCPGFYSDQAETTPESIESRDQLIKRVALGVDPAWLE